MKVQDLPAPVTAAKADWLSGGTWLGFTPSGSKPTARERCQGTVTKQFGAGFVIEYVTKSFGEPNKGFENDPEFQRDRDRHAKLAGKLVAVHRLRQSALPLIDFIGPDDFHKLQDIWSKRGQRNRWSVAFPIVESYEFVGDPPDAKTVFGETAYRRLFGRQSSTLRELKFDERCALNELEICEVKAPNAWVDVDEQLKLADLRPVNERILGLIRLDLSDEALEGFSAEKWSSLRRRAAQLATKLIVERQRDGRLQCDACRFDPSVLIGNRNVSPRALLDVHHKRPLALGPRLTQLTDLSLLCPTCHRLEHRLIPKGASIFDGLPDWSA